MAFVLVLMDVASTLITRFNTTVSGQIGGDDVYQFFQAPSQQLLDDAIQYNRHSITCSVGRLKEYVVEYLDLTRTNEFISSSAFCKKRVHVQVVKTNARSAVYVRSMEKLPFMGELLEQLPFQSTKEKKKLFRNFYRSLCCTFRDFSSPLVMNAYLYTWCKFYDFQPPEEIKVASVRYPSMALRECEGIMYTPGVLSLLHKVPLSQDSMNHYTRRSFREKITYLHQTKQIEVVEATCPISTFPLAVFRPLHDRTGQEVEEERISVPPIQDSHLFAKELAERYELTRLVVSGVTLN